MCATDSATVGIYSPTELEELTVESTTELLEVTELEVGFVVELATGDDEVVLPHPARTKALNIEINK